MKRSLFNAVLRSLGALALCDVDDKVGGGDEHRGAAADPTITAMSPSARWVPRLKAGSKLLAAAREKS